MAIVFKDGFDHLSAADLVLKWDAASSVVGASKVTGVYGFGSGQQYTNSGRIIVKTVPSQQTYVVCFHFHPGSSLPGSDTQLVIFRESTTTHTDIRVTATGAIRATRNGTSLGVSSAGVIAGGNWYWVEIKVKVDNTTGTVDVKVGSTDVLNLTGQDTQNGGTASIDNIQLNTIGVAHTWDNVHILDTTGSAPLNDRPGEEWRIETQVPSAAGNSTQFTPSAGSNYQNVDDATQDGDSTYNSSSTVGHIDLFTIPDFTAGVVREVQTCIVARKDDGGVREIREKCRSGGSNFNGSTQTLTSSYAVYRQNRAVDPATSAAWADANNFEPGYELVT